VKLSWSWSTSNQRICAASARKRMSVLSTDNPSNFIYSTDAAEAIARSTVSVRKADRLN
jgi:hypothetical protein